jgi:glutaredoxin
MRLVTLYTRPGCHLCEEAKREIEAAGCRDAYTLREIDVDSDPALKARYGWEIPVVTIDGIVAFKYRLTADEFRRQLLKN